MAPSPCELGPEGTGTGPQKARPKASGTGQPVDDEQGRISLQSLNLVLRLESSDWDGLKPRDHSVAFPLYDFGQMNNVPILGLTFLIRNGKFGLEYLQGD